MSSSWSVLDGGPGSVRGSGPEYGVDEPGGAGAGREVGQAVGLVAVQGGRVAVGDEGVEGVLITLRVAGGQPVDPRGGRAERVRVAGQQLTRGAPPDPQPIG